jgi:hypothetical protein
MRRGGLSSDQVDTAIHLYQLGWSLARVGNHLDVAHTTVLAALRQRGVPTRDSHERARPASATPVLDPATMNASSTGSSTSCDSELRPLS